MGDDKRDSGSTPGVFGTTNGTPIFGSPAVADGAYMWRIARDSQKLDLNSSYAYLLWARDFARTSVVATLDGTVAGFIAGYQRPDAPDTVLVWQVAVDAVGRGKGIAGGMLDHLVTALPEVRYLETTVTPDNEPSRALFAAFARRWSAPMHSEQIFAADQFPDDHEPEDLFRIGPVRPEIRGAEPTGENHK